MSTGACIDTELAFKFKALHIAQSGWGARLTFEFAAGAQLAT